MMIATASILFSIESLIPAPFPWFRLGLANVVTVLSLKWWGVKETLIIVILRVLIASMLTGKLLQPVFVLSLGGSLAAALVMWWVLTLTKTMFSLVGISIWGAVAKNGMQLAIVSWIYFSNSQIFRLLPLLLPASVISGLLIGLIAILIDRRLSGLILGHIE